MSDYTDMLDQVKIPLRETSNALVDDADILKYYNEGGRKFADATACIRDVWLVPITPAGGGAMTKQFISDALNTFTKVTVDAGLSLYRYKIAKALWIDRMWLIGATERTEDRLLERIGPREIEKHGYLDPDYDATYPSEFRFVVAGEFELWPPFTDETDSLLIEGRRLWLPVVATTQEVCYLPDRFKDAPVNYARWWAGLQAREYDFAAEGEKAWMNDLARGFAEIDKEDMAGGLIRSIVQP